MADLFWVGGNATWDNTAGSKWATTSGGAGGAAVPTASDNVFLDANSGANTVTLSSSSVCRSLDCNGFTGTLSHPAATTLTIGDGTAGAGNIALRLVSGMTYTLGNTATSAISFVSTSSTQQTVASGTKTLGNVTFNGAGGSWILSDNCTSTTNGVWTVTAGTFNSNGNAVTCKRFVLSGSTTRTVTLGASTLTMSTNGGGDWWDASTTTNLTFNANTSTIVGTGIDNSGFQGGGLTYNTVTFTNSRSSVFGTNTFATWTITGNAGTHRATLQANQTVTGTLTATGANAGSGRVMFFGSDGNGGILLGGTQRTITAAAVSLTNVDFADIAGAGAATWSGTSIGDVGGNSNITFDTPVTRYWVATSGGSWSSTSSWSTSSGGASGASVPLAQDTVIFDSNSITSSGRTITGDVSRMGASVSFAGVLNNPTFTTAITNGDAIVRGDLTFKNGMAFTGTNNVYLAGRSTHTVNFGDQTQTFGILFAAGSGTYTLQNNINSNASSGVRLICGTLTANNYNVTCTTFAAIRNIARTINMGTGIWTVTGSGTAWSCGTNAGNLTINASTSTIKMTDATASTKNFDGGSKTYGTLWISGAGSGTFVILGSNTFSTFMADTPPHTINFTAGTTQTVTTWDVEGTAGNLMTLQSTSSGTAWNLSKSSGVVNSNYLSLQDSHAAGGATFYAGPNSTNVSGNTGWIFTAAPFNITKSGQYCIVKAQTAIAKSGTYDVTVPRSITKSGQYCVVVHQTTITKQGTYDVTLPRSIAKSGQYTVTTTRTPITKQGTYRVVTPQAAITKQGTYRVKTYARSKEKLVLSTVGEAVLL